MNEKAQLSAGWDACAFLTDRLRLLQLRGKAIDTRLAELQSQCNGAFCHKVEFPQKEEGDSPESEYGVGAFAAAALPPAPFSPHPAVHVEAPARLFSSDDGDCGSPPASSRPNPNPNPCWRAPESAGQRFRASEERNSSSPPIIILEVTDSGEATSESPAEGQISSPIQVLSGSGAKQTVCHSTALSDQAASSPAVTAAMMTAKGHANGNHEGKAHVSFLLDQIYKNSLPAQLGLPAAGDFRTTHREAGTRTGKQDVVHLSSGGHIQTAETSEVKVGVERGDEVQQPQPLQASSAGELLGEGNFVSVKVTSGVTPTLVAPLLQGSSPLVATTATTKTTPPALASFAAYPSSAASRTHLVGSSSSADYDEKAREALRNGEWKMAKDKKDRVYYYNTREKRSCWNLAKELRRLAEISSVSDSPL